MRMSIRTWVSNQLCMQTPEQVIQSVPTQTELFSLERSHPDIMFGGLPIEFANRLYLEISSQTGQYPISTTPLMNAVRLAESMCIKPNRRVVDVGCGLGNLSFGIMTAQPTSRIMAFDNLLWCTETTQIARVAGTVRLADIIDTPLPQTHYIVVSPPNHMSYPIMADIASKALWRSVVGAILPGRPGQWLRGTPEAYIQPISVMCPVKVEALPSEHAGEATTLYIFRKQSTKNPPDPSPENE